MAHRGTWSRLRTVVLQRHIDLHLPGVAATPLGHGVDAPLGHAQGRGGGEPHMAIDAAARIPATVGLVAVINADGQDIVARRIKIGSEVVLEGGVAIGARAEGVAVDINRAVHIDAIEGDEDAVGGRACGQTEVFPIPAYAAGKRAATGATGVANMEVAFDGPVVGQGETAPTTVVIGRGGHRGIVAEDKEPVGVKLDACAGLSCEGEQEEQEKEWYFLHIYCVLLYEYFRAANPARRKGRGSALLVSILCPCKGRHFSAENRQATGSL